jgi:hypothetical protein
MIFVKFNIIDNIFVCCELTLLTLDLLLKSIHLFLSAVPGHQAPPRNSVPLRMHAYVKPRACYITKAAQRKARSVFHHLHMGLTDPNSNPHGFIVHLE